MTSTRAVLLGTLALATFVADSAEAARRPTGRAVDNGPVLPAIRLAADNRVPACATPERLTAFLMSRNDRLDAKYRTIAHEYKKHGEAHGVRWDMAFHQMVLETNALKFRRGDGTPGDVKPHQNNFAGIGATGGGVPGEKFLDVATGVKAHIQHLVAYSGEVVVAPVSQRTRDVQDGVIKQSLKLGRTVRYDDLTRRWAADRNYARSMQVLRAKFEEDFCSGRSDPVATAALPASAERGGAANVSPPVRQRTEVAGASPRTAPPAPVPARAPARECTVMTASYGGAGALLIRTAEAGRIVFTALGVERGVEDDQARSFIANHASGGTVAGRYRSRDEAVQDAWARCDSEARR